MTADVTPPRRDSAAGERRPRWVYAHGQEPDYRFSFANERTFLAWIRTALALLAAGVAVDTVELSSLAGVQKPVAVHLVALGLACSAASWLRWARSERAMREKRPLPSSGLTLLLGLGLLVVAVVVLVGVL